MQSQRRKELLALAGFVVVVIVLLGYTIGAFVVLWQTNDQANSALHIQDLYQQAHYLARAEDSVADEYYVNPGPEQQKEFHANADELTALLSTIAAQDYGNDRAFIKSLLQKQELYAGRAQRYFPMVDAGDPQARSFYNTNVDLLAADLNDLLLAKAKTEHANVRAALAQLKTTQQTITLLFMLLSALGLLALLFCWLSIRRYRRNLAHVRQAAWEQMEHMARTDQLTGLPNHRVTIERLQETLASCQYSQESCALLFVDLDHFKHINDHWGHQVGDAILHETGQRLQRTLRPDDVIGRYGGEEFVIVLPHTDLQCAKHLAEHVRLALARHPWPIQDEGEGDEGETTCLQEPTITASIGVAAFRLHGMTTSALLEAADSAMYQAKHSGRNRVCVASHVAHRVKDLLENEQISAEEVMALQALAAAALAHDGGISAHGHRLVKIAGAISTRLNCPPEVCHQIRMAAILHDIGKIGISEHILQKPGPLTDEEWKAIHQHPILGYHILIQVGGIFRELASLVVAHHERWDGQGYPLGLAGQGIPLGARILAVVDAYDAMTSLRVYHQPLSEDEARTELLRGAGGQFDPQVVNAFLMQLDAEHEEDSLE